MDTEKHTIFMRQQIPTFTPAWANATKCLPCNLDGVTERKGRFLVFEVKSGEYLSTGQERMLKALTAIPQFTVLVVFCRWAQPNEKGRRDFLPFTFGILDATGSIVEPHSTNITDFWARYTAWLYKPEQGHLPFTCSVEEFKEKFLHLIPETKREETILALEKARERE